MDSVSFTEKASGEPISGGFGFLVPSEILVSKAISAQFERHCLCWTE